MNTPSIGLGKLYTAPVDLRSARTEENMARVLNAINSATQCKVMLPPSATECCHLVCKVSSTPKACGVVLISSTPEACKPLRIPCHFFFGSSGHLLEESRSRLKIRGSQGCGGFSPPPGAQQSILLYVGFFGFLFCARIFPASFLP